MKTGFLRSILAAGIVCLGILAAGCGKKEDGGRTGSVYPDAVSVLTAAWDANAREFPAFGGSMENMVENAPGKLDVADKDTMTYTLLIPADVQDKVTDAATLQHMMNANLFTGAALKLEGMDAETAAEKIKTAFLENQFMCGIPDKILICRVDGYVVYVYGSADIVDPFKGDIEGLQNVKVLAEQNYE